MPIGEPRALHVAGERECRPLRRVIDDADRANGAGPKLCIRERTNRPLGRVLRTLELLGYLKPHDDQAYSPDAEREVIKRLKAFGYM